MKWLADENIEQAVVDAREEGLHMHSFAVSILPEGEWFIARCPELNVTSQGRTLEETQANIREAIALYIESFGL